MNEKSKPEKTGQKFLIEIHPHGQKPVSEIDVAIALKNLPLKTSQASFRVKAIDEVEVAEQITAELFRTMPQTFRYVPRKDVTFLIQNILKKV